MLSIHEKYCGSLENQCVTNIKGHKNNVGQDHLQSISPPKPILLLFAICNTQYSQNNIFKLGWYHGRTNIVIYVYIEQKYL